MVKRYPHSAVITYKDPGIRDPKGVLIEGMTHTVSIECRFEPKSASWMIKETGLKVSHSGEIFCPVFQEEVPEGAEITVLGRTFRILRLMKFQQHAKIWV